MTATFGDDFRMGPSATIGFDWRFKKLPIGLQIDWTPTWLFINDNHFSLQNGAITARWLLGRN